MADFPYPPGVETTEEKLAELDRLEQSLIEQIYAERAAFQPDLHQPVPEERQAAFQPFLAEHWEGRLEIAAERDRLRSEG